MGQICALYEELVTQPPCSIQPTPSRQQPMDVQLELDNLSRRRKPACELHQSAVEKIHDRLRGHLLVFTDGSPSLLRQLLFIWQPTTSLLQHPNSPWRSSVAPDQPYKRCCGQTEPASPWHCCTPG
ncbi:hypothetical protein HPB52_006013 [Rhipicephalus sanguineus]|uniref:Uncharacterized protein n=1 Tax=Rhipicephalus sanguineus TaxID=34632 RepID=A0A9D4PUZ5_RHISA|nr:hypothetical protein HPB52_006013 [Rhipicephalus sanguineus]